MNHQCQIPLHKIPAPFSRSPSVACSTRTPLGSSFGQGLRWCFTKTNPSLLREKLHQVFSTTACSCSFWASKRTCPQIETNQSSHAGKQYTNHQFYLQGSYPQVSKHQKTPVIPSYNTVENKMGTAKRFKHVFHITSIDFNQRHPDLRYIPGGSEGPFGRALRDPMMEGEDVKGCQRCDFRLQWKS